ncbi:MAG: hypothetical protein K9K67_03365 [Bacteriovoracaceae bacterium]|nr:hypothetical protein [Bacteriovoracaceae bacterium]
MLPNLLNDNEFQLIQNYCFDRYGIEKEVWIYYSLYKRKEGLWLVNKGIENQIDLSQAESFGLRILSGKNYPYKITRSFVQVFLKHMSKGLIEVTSAQAESLLKRETIQIEAGPNFQKGYYVCLYQEKFVAIALRTQDAFVSQVPKSLTGQLSNNLKFSE